MPSPFGIRPQESVVEPSKKPKSSSKLEPNSRRKTGAWAYASEGMQLAITLLLGVYVGYRLDVWKETLPWFTLAGSFLGIVVGLYHFLRKFLK